MQKLSKNEFMTKVINDKYEKRRQEKDQANSHTIENIGRVNNYKTKKGKW